MRPLVPAMLAVMAAIPAHAASNDVLLASPPAGPLAAPHASLLATPLDTSLAAPPAAPASTLPGASPLVAGGLIAGGEITTGFGSGGERSSAVRLDSGLIGGNTRAFVEIGSSQGPRWHDRPTAGGDGAALGIQTALPHGFTVEVEGGVERDRLRLPGGAGGPATFDRSGS